MKKQLSELYSLLKVVVPELTDYFKKHESSNMFFCFRWLLVHFKREFSQDEIMTLWEVNHLIYIFKLILRRFKFYLVRILM